MNANKIGRDLPYDSKDFSLFSDSHILTVSIISIFAVILAVLGVCFFFKICEYEDNAVAAAYGLCFYEATFWVISRRE